jgi:hypothetical protein
MCAPRPKIFPKHFFVLAFRNILRVLQRLEGSTVLFDGGVLEPDPHNPDRRLTPRIRQIQSAVSEAIFLKISHIYMQS